MRRPQLVQLADPLLPNGKLVRQALLRLGHSRIKLVLYTLWPRKWLEGCHHAHPQGPVALAQGNSFVGVPIIIPPLSLV